MRFRADSLRFSGVLASVVSLLSLAACSTDLEPSMVLTRPADFHESFGAMSFKVLPAEEPVRLGIEDEDPVFSFEGGMSRYEALSLPDLAQPYVLRIESEVAANKNLKNGTIFYPVLTFLDGNKAPIRTFDNLPYVMQKQSLGAKYIVASIQISDQLAAARYVVIHTQDDKLNWAIGRDRGKEMLMSSGFDTMMFAPITEPRYRYEFAPRGWLTVSAAPPSKARPPKPVEY